MKCAICGTEIKCELDNMGRYGLNLCIDCGKLSDRDLIWKAAGTIEELRNEIDNLNDELWAMEEILEENGVEVERW